MVDVPIFGACGCFGVLISLAATVFWVWILIDCLMNEASHGNDKLIWAIVIILMPLLGALLYFFIRRPQRKATLGR